MIDTKRTGKRCRAKKVLRSHAGMIPAHNQGTIAYEVENLGRRLVLVRWDRGPSTYVFLDDDEIEVMDESDLYQHCEHGGSHAFNQRIAGKRIHDQGR
jgi:hypothetical protein